MLMPVNVASERATAELLLLLLPWRAEREAAGRATAPSSGSGAVCEK